MTIEKMRREVVALRRSTDEWKVRAERDALMAVGGGGSSCEGRSIDSTDGKTRSTLRHVSTCLVSPTFDPVKTPKIR